MPKGKFITFEGIDGCGKTTQLNLLVDWLNQQQVDFVVTREPGSTPVGDGIRSILLDSKTKHLTAIGEALLYYASRIQNVEQVIRPALDQGKIVFCDRFHDASWAYQGFGRQLGIEFMRNLDDLVLDGFHPDHTILIEIDIETSIRRAKARNTTSPHDENRFELEAREFFERVAAGYRWLAQREPGRIHVMNGNRTAEEIQADVRELVEPWVSERK